MAHNSVQNVPPTREAWVPGHLPAANAFVAAHGGKYLAGTAAHEFMADKAYELVCTRERPDQSVYLTEGKDDLDG